MFLSPSKFILNNKKENKEDIILKHKDYQHTDSFWEDKNRFVKRKRRLKKEKKLKEWVINFLKDEYNEITYWKKEVDLLQAYKHERALKYAKIVRDSKENKKEERLKKKK